MTLKFSEFIQFLYFTPAIFEGITDVSVGMCVLEETGVYLHLMFINLFI